MEGQKSKEREKNKLQEQIERGEKKKMGGQSNLLDRKKSQIKENKLWRNEIKNWKRDREDQRKLKKKQNLEERIENQKRERKNQK